jgi:hypothetical protein
MQFTRLGGLSPVKYKKVNDAFQGHYPPRRKGIWAFPYPYIELFLCMWDDKHKLELKNKGFRIFEYNGYVWHHLGHDEWTKSTIGDYAVLLNQMKHKDVNRLHEMGDKDNIIDPYKRGLGGFMNRDHLEIFIEKADLGKIR